MAEVFVTVTMNPQELKLFRRALAKAADEKLLDRTLALTRICELDALRWDAEDLAGKPVESVGESRRQRVA